MDFTQAFEQYAEPIRGYIFRRVHSHELADDLTQETFIKALKAWSTIRGETVQGWLYQIAHNLIVDQARRASLVAWAPLDDAYQMPYEDNSESYGEREQIETTLSILAPNYASVLRLCLDGGNLPYAVLAVQAGITEQSFKMFAAAYAEQQKGA